VATTATIRTRQVRGRTERIPDNSEVFLVVPAEDHDDPVEWLAPCLRQPGCQVDHLTLGFASPPRDGFACIGKGSPLITV